MNPADDLTARIRQIAERARQRPRPPAPKPTPAQVVRLPLWPAELRACPSCVLRSALFGVVQRGRRKALERAILATWEGVTIRYTGWRLDQADLDVWLAALHLAREHHLGVRVPVTVNAMLRTICSRWRHADVRRRDPVARPPHLLQEPNDDRFIRSPGHRARLRDLSPDPRRI